MTDRSRPLFATRRRAPRLLAGLLCLGLGLGLALAWGSAQGAETTTLLRSDAPQTLSGDGDRVLIVEGPFGLAWQSAGGRFSIQATARAEEHTSALQSLMRPSYALFCLNNNTTLHLDGAALTTHLVAHGHSTNLTQIKHI